MKIIALVVGVLIPFASTIAIPLHQYQDAASISSFIARQASRERGDEYPDARKIMAGDLNGDGVKEAVVLYTIESQRGSNNYIQHLAVFTHRKGKLVAIAQTAVGGKSWRSVELSSVEAEKVQLETLSYAPKDASCCPSIKGTTSYALVGQTLRERKARSAGPGV